MGNPTNELRAKLDELGVRWWPDVYYRDTNTCWRVGDFEWRASEKKDGKLLIGCTCAKYLTPEQAVAATVGERNPDGLPIGLTVSNDGNLLNWVGENYVRQDAATVGRGNLTAEQVREAIMSADRWRKPMGDTGMTNTHLIIRDDGWQAIADKLNATVGAGTCHSTSKWTNVFKCSVCGFEYDFVTDPYQGPKFCPRCGRKVVVK